MAKNNCLNPIRITNFWWSDFQTIWIYACFSHNLTNNILMKYLLETFYCHYNFNWTCRSKVNIIQYFLHFRNYFIYGHIRNCVPVLVLLWLESYRRVFNRKFVWHYSQHFFCVHIITPSHMNFIPAPFSFHKLYKVFKWK